MAETTDVGAMAALRAPATEADSFVAGREDRLWVAVYNSPSYTVLSGDRKELEDMVARTAPPEDRRTHHECARRGAHSAPRTDEGQA